MLEEAAVSICWVAIKTDMIETPVSLLSPAAVSLSFTSSLQEVRWGIEGGGLYATLTRDPTPAHYKTLSNKSSV